MTFQLSLEGQLGFGAVKIWGKGAAGSAGDDKQQRKEADQRREHQPSCGGLVMPPLHCMKTMKRQGHWDGRNTVRMELWVSRIMCSQQKQGGEPGSRNRTYTGGSGRRQCNSGRSADG